MKEIDPNKKYSLQEINKSKLIPGIKSYATLYNLITEPIPCDELMDNNKPRNLGLKRILRKDENRLKAETVIDRWNSYGRHFVSGQNILDFIEMRKEQKKNKNK